MKRLSKQDLILMLVRWDERIQNLIDINDDDVIIQTKIKVYEEVIEDVQSLLEPSSNNRGGN